MFLHTHRVAVKRVSHPTFRADGTVFAMTTLLEQAVVALTWGSICIGLLEACFLFACFLYACTRHGVCQPSRLFAIATRKQREEHVGVHPSPVAASALLLHGLGTEEERARRHGHPRRAAQLHALGSRLDLQHRQTVIARARCENEEVQLRTLQIDAERETRATRSSSVHSSTGMERVPEYHTPSPSPTARVSPHQSASSHYMYAAHTQASLRGTRHGARLELRRLARDEETERRYDKSACLVTTLLVAAWMLAFAIAALVAVSRSNVE